MNDPLLKKVKLKSLEEIVARARDIISRHRRRFLQRNLRPCALNCKQAEIMGRKVIGCHGCESHDPNQCLKTEKFSPINTKEELFKQFADQLRDPGVLLREYRDVVVFLWVLGAFDEDQKVDESIVPLVENKNVSTGARPTLPASSTSGDTETEEPNYNVASPRRPSGTNHPVPAGTGDHPEPNYNRAESPNSVADARQRKPSLLQRGAKSAR